MQQKNRIINEPQPYPEDLSPTILNSAGAQNEHR